MLTTNKIAEAWVVVAAQNDWPTSRDRNLRPLISADLNRVRRAKELIQSKWVVQKEINKAGGEVVSYYDMRSECLDRWASEHNWHPTTRETYASLLATLVNWGREGVPEEHHAILTERLPGAELFLIYLEGYIPKLI